MGKIRGEITQEQCAALYLKGYSVRAIAKELGCAYGTAYSRVRSSGVNRRPQWQTSPKCAKDEKDENLPTDVS